MSVIFLVESCTPCDCEPLSSLLVTMTMTRCPLGSPPMLMTVTFGFTTYDYMPSSSLLMLMSMLMFCTVVLMIRKIVGSLGEPGSGSLTEYLYTHSFLCSIFQVKARSNRRMTRSMCDRALRPAIAFAYDFPCFPIPYYGS